MINPQENRISPITVKTFSELGFKEREHLQEWLANQPSALGEELLIIQKEFDGFDDTKERLDLLALDKAGNLVIIENKLDDSGRDVVWQAIKYASYCASLTKLQIVDIYQKYLDRYAGGGDAPGRICDFLDTPDLDEVKVNNGNSQRIMFIAANFRKEVTSTALWLLGQGIAVQCFKVTPYAMGEQLLLNVEQVIPTPEAEELMISMSAKGAEEKNTEGVLKSRHTIRLAFWEKAMEAFRKSDCNLYNNINPGKDHWASAGSGVSSCPYQLIFGQKEIRVELNLARADAAENKFLFDELYKAKDKIEQTVGHELDWRRMDDKKASRIQYAKEADGYNKELWPQWIAWMIEEMSRLENAFKTPLQKAAGNLKQAGALNNSADAV